MKKMKNLLSLRYILLLLLSCTISFYACKKSNTDSTSIAEKSNINVARIQKLTIESLVDTMFSETTDKKDNSFFIQYRNLSPLELEKYNEIALNKTCKLMKEKDGYTLSENEKQQTLLRLKNFNDLSIRTFKKSYTALTAVQLQTLETHTPKFTAGCSSYSFPIEGAEATVYNTDCSAVDRVSTPDHPTDCDYQLKFTGFDYPVSKLYIAAKSYVLYFTFKYKWDNFKKVLSRQSGSNIYIIIGNGIEWLIPAPYDWYLKNYVVVEKPTYS